MTATVTEITPGTRYIVHGLENGRAVAIPVQATCISDAQEKSAVRGQVFIHSGTCTADEVSD